MNQSLALQILNGYLTVFAVSGMLIFLRYLLHNREAGYEALRPAIALLGIWIGEIVLRGSIFQQRTFANAGLASSEPTFSIWLGGTIVSIAFLCCIRVFAPAKWGYWSWLGTLIFATIVVGCSLLYAYWR